MFQIPEYLKVAIITMVEEKHKDKNIQRNLEFENNLIHETGICSYSIFENWIRENHPEILPEKKRSFNFHIVHGKK